MSYRRPTNRGSRDDRDDRDEGGIDFFQRTQGRAGPPLIYFIGLAVVAGVVSLILALVLTPNLSQQRTAGANRPAAPAPTAAPTVAPTAAPAAAATAAPAAAATAAPAAAATAAPAGGGEPLDIAAEGLNLDFTVDQLRAPANTLVTLTFNNNSNGLRHNWVLVNGDATVAAAVNDAATTNPPDFGPPEGLPEVIASTAMLAPGAAGEVTFTTPGAGTYTFLCTFPGHFQGGMTGTLVIP